VKNLFLSFSLIFFSACVGMELKPDGKTPGIAIQRIFYGEPNDINLAIRAAMKKYPVKEDNLDLGNFETENIRGEKMFKSPSEEQLPMSSGLRYHISIHTIKGKVDNRIATRIVLKKIIEKSRDFLSEAEQLASDGIEENVIFYRIQRELTLDRAVKRAQEKPHS
jgi:hypothetical protein